MDWLLSLRDLGDGTVETEPATEVLAGYGGFLMSCAAAAAARTVHGLVLHSLQASFLTRPAPGPVRIAVEATRSGRSFATRRVVIGPPDRPVVTATLTFGGTHDAADGVDWQPAAPPPAPEPSSLPRFPAQLQGFDAIDLRPLHPDPDRRTLGRVHPYWGRPARPVGSEPAGAAVALALVSDWMVIFNSAPPGEEPEGFPVTLNHALWVHRGFDPDDWLRYSCEPGSVAGRRALNHGRVHDRSGRLVATFAQECLVRGAPPATAGA